VLRRFKQFTAFLDWTFMFLEGLVYTAAGLFCLWLLAVLLLSLE
jgi:hypothetical protein